MGADRARSIRPVAVAPPADINRPCGAFDADSFTNIEQRATKLMGGRTKKTRTAESQRVQWEQTRKDRQECIDISDEKVALAEQTYELVDGHVRRLDETLQQFEAELHQTDPSRLADLKLAAVQADPFAAAGIGQGSRKRGARDLQYSDMPIDDNEPRYCTCRQVSFGEMVACDNDDVSSPTATRPTDALPSAAASRAALS